MARSQFEGLFERTGGSTCFMMNYFPILCIISLDFNLLGAGAIHLYTKSGTITHTHTHHT